MYSSCISYHNPYMYYRCKIYNKGWCICLCNDAQVNEWFKSYVVMIWIRTVTPDPRLNMGINSGQVEFQCQTLTCQLCLRVHT